MLDTSIAGHRWTPSPETGSGTSAHKTMRNALRNSSEGPYFRCRVTEHRQRASRQVRNPDNTGMVSGGHHTGRGQLHHQQRRQRACTDPGSVPFLERGSETGCSCCLGSGAFSCVLAERRQRGQPRQAACGGASRWPSRIASARRTSQAARRAAASGLRRWPIYDNAVSLGLTEKCVFTRGQSDTTSKPKHSPLELFPVGASSDMSPNRCVLRHSCLLASLTAVFNYFRIGSCNISNWPQAGGPTDLRLRSLRVRQPKAKFCFISSVNVR